MTRDVGEENRRAIERFGRERRQRIAAAMEAEEQAMGRPCELIEAHTFQRGDTEVDVVFYETVSREPLPGMNKRQRQRRIAAHADFRQLYSAVVDTDWLPPENEEDPK